MPGVVSATFLHSRQTWLKLNEEDGSLCPYRATADAAEAKAKMDPRTSDGNRETEASSFL